MAGENPNSIDPFGIVDGFSAAEPYQPSRHDLELLGNLRRQFEKDRDYRALADHDWPLYIEYLSGNQLLYRDVNTQELIRVLDGDRQRLWSINNQLGPIAESRAGKITRGQPRFTVSPGVGGGQEQIQGCRVADRFIEYFEEKEQVLDLYEQAVKDESWAAVGFIQLYLDPLAGQVDGICQQCGHIEEFSEEPEQCMACGGEQVPTPAGDIRCRYLDPRQVFLEAGARNLKEARRATIRHTLPVSEVRAMFPEHAEYIKADTDIYAEDGVKYSYSHETGSLHENLIDDHCFLWEYHEKPSGKHPKGRLIYYTKECILEDEDSPYWKLKRIPIFGFFGPRTPGRLYPIPWAHHAWHRQKELNELETHFREYGEVVARPKTLIPLGNRISDDEITATSAQIIRFNAAAGAIEYLRPPELPQALYNRKAELINDMRTQANVTMQEMGATPTDPNGRVMAMLEAESDQTIGPIVRQHRRELGELYRGALILAQQYMDPETKFNMMSDEAFEVYSFQDLNLKPGWSITIEAEDGLSKNQALRLNEANTMAQFGVFGDIASGQFDVTKYAKMARLKIPGIGIDTKSPEFAAAMAAVKKVEDGQEYIASIEDDPQIFADVIMGWLRVQGRRYRDSQDPLKMQTYQNIQSLLMQYQMLLFQAQMQQMGGMMPGAPGASPADSMMSAPGGTPNGTLPEQSGQPGTVMDAQAMLSEADQTGESAARAGMGQEN